MTYLENNKIRIPKKTIDIRYPTNPLHFQQLIDASIDEGDSYVVDKDFLLVHMMSAAKPEDVFVFPSAPEYQSLSSETPGDQSTQASQ